ALGRAQRGGPCDGGSSVAFVERQQRPASGTDTTCDRNRNVVDGLGRITTVRVKRQFEPERSVAGSTETRRRPCTDDFPTIEYNEFVHHPFCLGNVVGHQQHPCAAVSE